MDDIFGQRTNVEPTFLVHATNVHADSSSDNSSDQENQLHEHIRKCRHTRRATDGGIQGLTQAISKLWESQDQINKEKLEKDFNIRREEVQVKRMDVEAHKAEAEGRKIEAENRQRELELELLQLRQNTP